MESLAVALKLLRCFLIAHETYDLIPHVACDISTGKPIRRVRKNERFLLVTRPFETKKINLFDKLPRHVEHKSVCNSDKQSSANINVRFQINNENRTFDVGS